MLVVPQVGQLPPVDPVGAADDGALGGLPEDLGQAHHGDHPAADKVGEQVARPHAGQLVGVAHQDQPALRPQGGQQAVHEGDIHHGGLVHDHRVGLQRVAFIVGKHQPAGVGVVLGLQKAVDRGPLRAAQLPQPLGGPPRGGGQGGLQPQGIEQGQHSTQGGGLAGARSAGEEHHLAGGGQLHCLALLWGIGDALLGLDAVDEFLQPMGGHDLPRRQLPQPEGHILLRLAQIMEVDGLLPGHRLLHHLAPLQQGLQIAHGALV